MKKMLHVLTFAILCMTVPTGCKYVDFGGLTDAGQELVDDWRGKTNAPPVVVGPPVTNTPPVDVPATNIPPVIRPPIDVPERTGIPSYTGSGKFNTFLELGLSEFNPINWIRFACWFRVDSWSLAENQPGAVLICKGIVGKHWSFAISVHPDRVQYGASVDSVRAPANIRIGQWYYLYAEVDRNDATFWLDGHALADPGRETGRGLMFTPGNQPIRIGGYYTDYPGFDRDGDGIPDGATWFNQSIDGQITDWKYEIR